MRNVFVGPNGPRAGWRLLIFFAILIPVGYGANQLIDPVAHQLHTDLDTPLGGTIMMGIFAAALLLVSGLMAVFEHRSIADYGLPWRRAFCGQFWQGTAISFASLAALLLTLRVAGAFSFGPLALHGADIWKYGLLWAAPLFFPRCWKIFSIAATCCSH
jgi:uncharacterized protein